MGNDEDATKTGGNTQNHAVETIKNVKLPAQFWHNDPELFFSVAESQFALNNITADITKFRLLIGNLDAKTLATVADIVNKPPEQDKYDAIKKRIIDSFAESQETKLRRLLHGLSLGDDKPSAFLQRLRNLAGTSCNDNILRSLFLEQMPENIRGILAVAETTALSDMATQADRILDVIRPAQIFAVSQVNPHTNEFSSTDGSRGAAVNNGDTDSRFHELTQKIEALSQSFENFRARQRNGHYRNRSRGRSTQRRRSPSAGQGQDEPCFYHRKYGNAAYRCRAPCNFKTPEN